MDIYTSKRCNVSIYHYSRLFDKKYLILKFILISSLLLLGFTLFKKSLLNDLIYHKAFDSFLHSILYTGNIAFDLLLPLFAALTLIFSFYKDYINNAYEIMIFLDNSKYLNNLVKRFIFYTSLWLIISTILILLCYFNSSEIVSLYLLFLKHLPPLLLFSSLTFTLLVYTKNVPVSCSIILALFSYELFSAGRLGKKFAIYFDPLYINTINVIYYNRLFIIIVSVIILIIGINKSKRL